MDWPWAIENREDERFESIGQGMGQDLQNSNYP